jgi:hypothetical protein
LTFLKRHRASKPLPPTLPYPTWWREAWTAQDDADHAWLAQWRRCLLDHAYHALKKHQHQSPGNLFHTVLTLVVDYHWEDTKTLAARTSAIIGRPISAEAFRKQVSRARFMFAKLLVQEVVRTLDNPTPDRLKEELRELALWDYVREFLPSDQSLPGKNRESS